MQRSHAQLHPAQHVQQQQRLPQHQQQLQLQPKRSDSTTAKPIQLIPHAEQSKQQFKLEWAQQWRLGKQQ